MDIYSVPTQKFFSRARCRTLLPTVPYYSWRKHVPTGDHVRTKKALNNVQPITHILAISFFCLFLSTFFLFGASAESASTTKSPIPSSSLPPLTSLPPPAPLPPPADSWQTSDEDFDVVTGSVTGVAVSDAVGDDQASMTQEPSNPPSATSMMDKSEVDIPIGVIDTPSPNTQPADSSSGDKKISSSSNSINSSKTDSTKGQPAQSLATDKIPTSSVKTSSNATAYVGQSIYDPLARFLQSTSTTNYGIVINLPAFRLYLYHKGALVRSYPIAVGKVVSPSNLGTAHIINKVANPTYYPPDWAKKGLKPIPPGPDNPVGTLWMGLSIKGYGIHGTNVPSSIGHAMSGGCIRMYNSDVEALAKLVPIQTPVTFVYQLVTAWRTSSGTPMIEVFPDIYRQGKPTVSSTLVHLSEAGVTEEANQDVLREIIATATGKPEVLPVKTPISIDGFGIIDGYTAVDQTYVSVNGLAKLLGEPSAVKIGNPISIYGQQINNAMRKSGTTYTLFDTAVTAFGLLKKGQHSMQVSRLTYHDQELPNRLFVTGGDVLVPAGPLASALGYEITWDIQESAPVVGGRILPVSRIIADRAYISRSEAEDTFGVRIKWNVPIGIAEIQRPSVTLGDVVTEGFWHEGNVWLPVRMLAEHLGSHVEWDAVKQMAQVGQRYVQGLLLGGRLYMSQADMVQIFPEFSAQWNETTLTLSLATVQKQYLTN